MVGSPPVKKFKHGSVEAAIFENEIKKMREGEKDPQTIVKEEELAAYLADGWQFVSVLPSQRILIRRTNSCARKITFNI